MLSNRRFYYLGLALVAGLSFGLRFWQLGRFNALVFDEVYYVKFAQAYLAGEPVWDAHPPLGKLAIATGIWLYEHMGWLRLAAQTVMADVELAPVSYRWMNALTGALVPLVVVGLAGRLTEEVRQAARGRLFAILAGVFVAMDGLFVTESRYGLLNIYMVFFGLLGHWLWLVAAREKRRGAKALLRVGSGLALGAAIAVKWNGLGYVLALVLWAGWQQVRKHAISASAQSLWSVPWCNFGQKAWQSAVYLGLVPLVTYCLCWWPHIPLNEGSFFSIHRTLFLFHQGLEDVQVACSRWFTWPLLIKPIAYWYETAGARVYTVNNLGNPVLWWFSSASIALLCVDQLFWAARKIRHQLPVKQASLLIGSSDNNYQSRDNNYQNSDNHSHNSGNHSHNSVVGYLLIGYLANWLPWLLVARCTYNYLYMPAAVFGFMLLAWLLSGWLTMPSSVSARRFGVLILSAIALAGFFWLPLALGTGLSPEQLQLRWWLPSWI